MKNMFVAAAIMLSATSGWAWSYPVSTFACQNSQNQSLKVVETASRVFRGPPIADLVSATFSSNGTVENFEGSIVVNGYAMQPAADGKDVTLKVVKKQSFAHQCGRCPPGQFPDPEPKPATYYAKLTVGNQVYDFTCKHQNPAQLGDF